MLLAEVAAVSDAVAGTPSRGAKTALIADLLGRCDPDEVGLVVAYLTGDLRQRRTGVGVGALRDLPPPAAAPSLAVAQVDAVFADLAAMSGRGSAAARRTAFRSLMAAGTESEQRLLTGLVSGDLRQGAAAGVMAEAVARAGGVAAADVRSALTVSGSLPAVATALRRAGRGGLAAFAVRVGTPLAPMLASSATSVHDGFERAGGGVVGVEWKIDGIRVQLHRDGSDVAVFSRSGDDLTAALPDVVEQVAALPIDRVVLDAEAIVMRPDGRPAPFQVTGRRVGRRGDVLGAREHAPLSLFVFDAMHVDGVDLLGEPASQRWTRLAEVVPGEQQVPRLVTESATDAEAFVADALARGHEGVVLKSADSPYSAGRRGASWVKVKPRIVLDLVVVAVEWGHGRRTGRLSNLHLAAYDPAGAFGAAGGFVMLGKTFKGMTDAMLAWQTQRFLSLADGPSDGSVVRVRPEQVVEIAIDGVQTSSRYPGGVALRFARVLRYRPDKAPTEADTIESVRQLVT